MIWVAVMALLAGFVFGAGLVMAIVDKEDLGYVSNSAKFIFIWGLFPLAVCIANIVVRMG